MPPHEFLTLSLNMLPTMQLRSFNILSRAGMFAIDQKGEKFDLHHIYSCLYNLSSGGGFGGESPETEKLCSLPVSVVSHNAYLRKQKRKARESSVFSTKVADFIVFINSKAGSSFSVNTWIRRGGNFWVGVRTLKETHPTSI